MKYNSSTNTQQFIYVSNQSYLNINSSVLKKNPSRKVRWKTELWYQCYNILPGRDRALEYKLFYTLLYSLISKRCRFLQIPIRR